MFCTRRRAAVLASAGLGVLMTGCTEHYMPLGDDQFVLNFTIPSRIPLGKYYAMICEPDGSLCGRRKVDPELYDPDQVRTEYNGTLYENHFEVGDEDTVRIQPGNFVVAGIEFSETRSGTEVVLNDFPPLYLDIPPRLVLTSPMQKQEISRSSANSIRVEWTPMSAEYPVRWKFFPLNNEPEELPCDTLAWGAFEGEGEDKGFVEIPMDVVPSDLPPEGCYVVATVGRIRNLSLPEGISNGFARSTVLDGVLFRVLP